MAFNLAGQRVSSIVKSIRTEHGQPLFHLVSAAFCMWSRAVFPSPTGLDRHVLSGCMLFSKSIA
eukprot:360779-Chlamydomonas_euryale.AAC.3